MYSVTIKIPGLESHLLFESMTGHEELSRLSRYNLSVLSKKEIQATSVLGKPVVVKINFAGQPERVIHAYITAFNRSAADVNNTSNRYHLEAHCWLWFLTRSSDCRIFQNKRVVDIFKDILTEPQYKGFSLRDEAKSSNVHWDYAVQYRETDFNFICRLLEQEGIYFYFEHTDSGHELVLCDNSSVLPKNRNKGNLSYLADSDSELPTHKIISSWSTEKNIQPSQYVLADYNPLDKAQRFLEAHHAGNYDAKALSFTEIYDYPGEFEKKEDGKQYAKIRAEELHTGYCVYTGASNNLEIASGCSFTLSGLRWKNPNEGFLITSVTFQLTENAYESGGGSVTSFSNRFKAIPLKIIFRPARITPKPCIQGLQSAIVTGPKGSEIYSNKHSQVKVRFHWDRNVHGKPDEQSSCWIRVAQPWAGKKRGFFAIPRVGDEVIVAFEEGDPDRPLIIGSVYNDINRSKHTIETNETRTGLVTLSSKQGADNFNELSFEDKKGSELIYLRAEKDLQHLINHDVMTQVNHDVTITVDNNVTEDIKNNHSVKIGNNDTVKVANNRVVDIGQADSLKAGTDITIKAGQTITIEAGTTITLKAGPSTIELGPSGITIKGPIVKIN